MTGLLGGFADGLPGLDVPSPPCPSCGGLMGDGSRVSHGVCSRCYLQAKYRGRCYCGRPILRTAPSEQLECSECYEPIPESALAPSDPTTPGGVFDRHYP